MDYVHKGFTFSIYHSESSEHEWANTTALAIQKDSRLIAQSIEQRTFDDNKKPKISVHAVQYDSEDETKCFAIYGNLNPSID